MVIYVQDVRYAASAGCAGAAGD